MKRGTVNTVPRTNLATRHDVERLVQGFYRDVNFDDILGPVFAQARVDWGTHIPKLVDFWSWQLLGIPGYTGQPLRAHEPVNAMVAFTDAHYERWLELFEATVDDLFVGPTGEMAKARARKFAAALHRILA